jgi:Protein of unknown function (DUF2934)
LLRVDRFRHGSSLEDSGPLGIGHAPTIARQLFRDRYFLGHHGIQSARSDEFQPDRVQRHSETRGDDVMNSEPIPEAKSDSPQLDDPDSASVKKDQEIAKLAYELWIQRGCPISSPEEDWYSAEEHIHGRATSELDSYGSNPYL